MTDDYLEYLAIPYTHDDEVVMEYRADMADFIFHKLSMDGRLFYSPISSCHGVAKKFGMPRDWKFWKRLDETIIKACKKLVVVQLEGWNESTGVNAEIKIAKDNNIEIEYLDPTEYIAERIEIGRRMCA